MNNQVDSHKLMPQSSDCVRIVHLTDSHIFADPDGKLLGLSTRESFELVIERIKKEEYRPDLILATGDLSQDASPESYQYLAEKLDALNIPCFWIPGNHDKPETMAQHIKGKNLFSSEHLVVGDWQVCLLDTAVAGKVYGEVKPEAIARLKGAILQPAAQNTLVTMHHQPVPVGSVWLDRLGIKNANELFSAVKGFNNTCCFLWGHVHQDFAGVEKGVKLISTPSTCVQFRPQSSEFSAGDEAPGYRYLTLYPDGHIDTLLHRLEHIEFTVDYSVKGY